MNVQGREAYLEHMYTRAIFIHKPKVIWRECVIIVPDDGCKKFSVYVEMDKTQPFVYHHTHVTAYVLNNSVSEISMNKTFHWEYQDERDHFL